MAQPVSFYQRFGLLSEAFFMTYLVPRDGPGPVFGSLFRLPLLLRRWGWIALIPPNVLILTTRGRRTGLPRPTPVEFSPGPAEGTYLVMAGWGGRTDWCRNLRADPHLKVWLKGREWDAVAEPIPDAEVAAFLRQLATIAPPMQRVWSRWSDSPIDGSEASYLAAARRFPSFYLCPVKKAWE